MIILGYIHRSAPRYRTGPQDPERRAHANALAADVARLDKELAADRAALAARLADPKFIASEIERMRALRQANGVGEYAAE